MMLPEVLSFGKAVAQGSFLGALLLQLLGVAVPETPSGDHLLHDCDAPGNRVCGKERCALPWTREHLGVDREAGQKLKLCCSLFWFVMVCALPGFSKQEVQGPHMCTLWGFPGLPWVAWGRTQEYKMQKSDIGIYIAAIGTPLATQNTEDIQDH